MHNVDGDAHKKNKRKKNLGLPTYVLEHLCWQRTSSDFPLKKKWTVKFSDVVLAVILYCIVLYWGLTFCVVKL